MVFAYGPMRLRKFPFSLEYEYSKRKTFSQKNEPTSSITKPTLGYPSSCLWLHGAKDSIAILYAPTNWCWKITKDENI